MSSNKKNGIQKIKIKENINKNNDKTQHILKNESNIKDDFLIENNSKFNLNCRSLKENKKNRAIKTQNFQYKLELDENKIIENMFNKERNFQFEKGNLDDKFPEIYLKQRENLIFIIKKMIEKLRFTEQTYYQALLFMDILFYKQNPNSENKLKIVAVSSLILAAKFNENDPNIPNLTAFQSLKGKFYFDKEELKIGELNCLSQLKYNLGYYNPFQFLKIFLAFGFIFESDLSSICITEELRNPEPYEIKNKNNSFKSVDEIYKYTKKILQIAILNNKILENFNGFKIACAVVAFTREILFERNNYGDNEDEIVLTVPKKEKNYTSLNEEKNKFRWNDNLIRIYAINFEEFKSQYDIIKNSYTEALNSLSFHEEMVKAKRTDIENSNSKKHQKNKSCSSNNVVLSEFYANSKLNIPGFSGSISTSNSNSQENFNKKHLLKNLNSEIYNPTTGDSTQEKTRYAQIKEKINEILKNDIKRHNSEINDLYHREQIPKLKKKYVLDIKTDDDILFNYNKNNKFCNKYFTSNKKENLNYNYNIDNELTKIIINKQDPMHKNKDLISNYSLKKTQSENIKRENENILRKYEHYKNSDFEEYEKNYLNEKFENIRNKNSINSDSNLNPNYDIKFLQKQKKEKNIQENNSIQTKNIEIIKALSDMEINQLVDKFVCNKNIALSRDNTQNENSEKKIKEDYNFKKGLESEFLIQENWTNSQKNNVDNISDNLERSIKDNFNLRDYDINNFHSKNNKQNCEEIKQKEEKYSIIKEKLEKIRKKENIIEKDNLNEDQIENNENIKLSNQKPSIEEMEKKQVKNINLRSLSSKLSSYKPINQFANLKANLNSNFYNKNILRISVEKEIKNFKKARECDQIGITPEKIKINYNNNADELNKIKAIKNYEIHNNNNNSNNNKNENNNINKNRESLSKEFNKVLSNLKIDNILQKTKMIFNKQNSLNQETSKNKSKENNLDLNKFNISSHIVLPEKFEHKDTRNSKDNKLHDKLNNNLKYDFHRDIRPLGNENRKYEKVINKNKENLLSNISNNQSSTIIINNNININTYIDKGELIYSNDLENNKNNYEDIIHKNISTRDPLLYELNSKNSKEILRKNSNENENIKINRMRSSEENFVKYSKVNREKIINNIKSNWERKESSNSAMIVNSAKNYKNDYADNNYKNLLLCSYESGIKKNNTKNIEILMENRNNFYNGFERVKDKLKKYEYIDKCPKEEHISFNEDFHYNFNKNRICRNFDNISTRNENISPSYIYKNNHEKLSRPFSYIRNIDFDNQTNEIDYLFNNENKEKSKNAPNFLGRYDNISLKMNNINY